MPVVDVDIQQRFGKKTKRREQDVSTDTKPVGRKTRKGKESEDIQRLREYATRLKKYMADPRPDLDSEEEKHRDRMECLGRTYSQDARATCTLD
jgi:hypothetical protein